MKVHKQEGTPSKRHPVSIFSLLVTNRVFYNPYDKLCIFGVKIILSAFIVVQKSLTCFDSVLIRDSFSRYAVPGVVESGVPVLKLTHLISPMLCPGR